MDAMFDVGVNTVEKAQVNDIKTSLFAAYVSPRVSVVVPAMNEALNLPYVLPKIPVWVHEVLLVDGHSTDNTVEVARQLLPDIRIVQQEGRGVALRLCGGQR